MKLKTMLLSFVIVSLFGLTAYANNNAVKIINAAANLINALNGEHVEGNYRHFTPILANNMSRPCVGNDFRSWNDCIGVQVSAHGNIYAGEFRNGQRDGVGMIRVLYRGVSDENSIRSNVPSTYVGQFANDRINGVGTWTTDTGIAFAGEYVNNRLVKIFE